jgi:hypothetical protein
MPITALRGWLWTALESVEPLAEAEPEMGPAVLKSMSAAQRVT